LQAAYDLAQAEKDADKIRIRRAAVNVQNAFALLAAGTA